MIWKPSTMLRAILLVACVTTLGYAFPPPEEPNSTLPSGGFHSTPPPPAGNWTLCSSECAGGIQFRTCIQGTPGCPTPCSQPCNTQPCTKHQRRTLFPADIVWFLHSHDKMHPTLRAHKKTWAREVQTIVYFSTGAVDDDLPTIQMHDPRPQWHHIDNRQGVFTYVVFEWLAAAFPQARGFIHTDDDTFPILPRIRDKLDTFMCKNGGEFPYASAHPKDKGGTCVPYYQEQTKLMRKKCKPKKPFLPGNMMMLNRTLLQQMAKVANIDKCPPSSPDDQATGMLLQCSGGLKEKKIDKYLKWDVSYYEWDGRDPHHENPWHKHPLTNTSTADEWMQKDGWHHLRTPEDISETHRLFRASFDRQSVHKWP